MNESDSIYRDGPGLLVDFRFDESVARVFPDMIRRSVPGYETAIAMMAVFAGRFACSGTVYDLGCSLGASTISAARGLGVGCRPTFVLVDSSAAMLERCRDNVARAAPGIDTRYEHADVRDIDIEDASMVMLNFTLQFVDPADRGGLIRRISTGLRSGGALVLSEKIRLADQRHHRLLDEVHQAFKSANGYSETEISRKRAALERVMVTDTPDIHVGRLEDAGFDTVLPWFRCLNFASYLAIK